MKGGIHMISSRLKTFFLVAVVGSIVVALVGYYYTKKDLPPYPEKVVSESGELLTGKAQIMAGQQVWQKYGLMDIGSVWGHGTYRGPDFTAQALHNMGQNMREKLAQERNRASYKSLDIESKGAVNAIVINQIKTNRYDSVKDTLTLTPLQTPSLLENRRFYDNLFSEGNRRGPIRAETIKEPQERQNLADFFSGRHGVQGPFGPEILILIPTTGPTTRRWEIQYPENRWSGLQYPWWPSVLSLG